MVDILNKGKVALGSTQKLREHGRGQHIFLPQILGWDPYSPLTRAQTPRMRIRTAGSVQLTLSLSTEASDLDMTNSIVCV